MPAELTASVAIPAKRIDRRVAWLCGAVLFLEGYDIAAVGYAVPSLVDAWKIRPFELTQALTAGNVGLMIGSICAGLLGDRIGRKAVLIACVLTFAGFSFLTAFASSPIQLGALRFLTGLGLGGGLPITFALASNFAPQLGEARALSGYLECASGKTVIFSIMVGNHLPGTSDDREVMDKIVAAIAAAN